MSNLIKHTPIHSDGHQPVTRVRRFDHEWELADYDWDPLKGEGVFTYERTVEPDPLTKLVESVVVRRPQPIGRWHAGWKDRNKLA
jgi:hypothetical protein